VFFDEHWCFREIASRSWVSRANYSSHPPPVCERECVRKCVVFVICRAFLDLKMGFKQLKNNYDKRFSSGKMLSF